MGLETATKVSELNALWPLGTDPKAQGDDHLRLIKSVMQTGDFTGLDLSADSVSDSDGSMGEIRDSVTAIANPNLVINGDFSVWQRGTSFSSLGANYSADRWTGSNSVQDSVTRQTDVPDGEGFAYSGRFTATAGNQASTLTSIELQGTGVKAPFADSRYTLSFWVRGDAGNMTIALRFRDGAIATGNQVLVADLNTTQGAGWARKEFTFDLTGINPAATNICMALIFSWEADLTAYITGVKLEQGSQATPFIRAGNSIGGEFALCQRYYQRFNDTHVALGKVNSSNGQSANVVFRFPGPMRVPPTFTFSGNFNQSGDFATAIPVTNITSNSPSINSIGFVVAVGSTLGAIGTATQIITDGTGVLKFDAEL